MKTKLYNSEIELQEGERSVIAKISTMAVDRDGDVLIPQGCNSKDFDANPVVFFNHSYRGGSAMPIGKCDWIKREADCLTAKTTFAERPEGYPNGREWLPDTILSLFKQGVIRGFSVGFEPVEYRMPTPHDVQCFGKDCRQVFSKWKLLEYSVAPLPANQEALALAVAKGYVPADVAKDMFDYEYKAGAIKAEPTPAPARPAERRVVLVSGAAIKKQDSTNNLAVLKAKGRIYVV